jgi:hypothetical protein
LKPGRSLYLTQLRPGSINTAATRDSNSRSAKADRGFTLIELLVVIAIAEIKNWRDPRTTPPLVLNGLINDQVASPGNQDVVWLQERSTRKK